MKAAGAVDADAVGRGRLTNTKRIELLEHDREQHSRVITELVKSGQTFTPQQLDQLRSAMREVLADAGLRLDDAKLQDEAREDFRFLRRLRRSWDGSARRVGNAVLSAAIVIAGVIIASGVGAWLNGGGKGP